MTRPTELQVKRQHQVSRFHLSHFTNSDGRFHAYDMQTGQRMPSTLHPKNVAVSQWYYDHPDMPKEEKQFIDEHFTRIERELFHPRLRQIHQASKGNLFDLLEFAHSELWAQILYEQFIRTPFFMNYVEQLKKCTLYAVGEQDYSRIMQLKIEGNNDKKRMYINAICRNDRREIVVSEWSETYTCEVLFNATSRPFVISDNPVSIVRWTPDGLNRCASSVLGEDSYVFMPLTSKVAIKLMSPTYIQRDPPKVRGMNVLCSTQEVDLYNQWTFINPHRFVFSPDAAFDRLAQDVHLSNPNVCGPHDPRFIISHNNKVYRPWDIDALKKAEPVLLSDLGLMHQ